MAIYKCYIGRRPTEAWFNLSQDEQKDLLSKVNQAREQAGGKTVISCDIAWSGDGTIVFGVEEFPDLEAVQKHAKLLQDINWGRYLEGDSYLGTKYNS